MLPSVLFYSLSIALSMTQIATLVQLTSLEVCRKIRDNQIKILAIGSRGYRDEPGKHWVYLLVEDGYLFVVPFAKLTLDPKLAANNKLTIGEDYQNASKLFKVKRNIFTVTDQKVQYQKFSFITNDKDQHFLMRLYARSSDPEFCFELFRLDNGSRTEFPCQSAQNIRTGENFLLSMDSTVKPIDHADQWTMIEVWRYEVHEDMMRYSHVMKAEAGLMDAKPYPDSQFGRLPPTQKDIVTAFALIPNENVTLVLLSASGNLTIGQRQHLYTNEIGFESSVQQPLSQFVHCVMKDKATIEDNLSTSSTTHSDDAYQRWIAWATPAAVLVLVLIVACALCLGCTKKKRKAHRGTSRKKKRKNKKRNKKSPHNSIDLSANQSKVDTTSGPTSEINTSININSVASIFSKLTSMVSRNAKSTNKAKKSKVAASKKKDKKPKADQKTPESSVDGQKGGSTTS